MLNAPLHYIRFQGLGYDHRFQFVQPVVRQDGYIHLTIKAQAIEREKEYGTLAELRRMCDEPVSFEFYDDTGQATSVDIEDVLDPQLLYPVGNPTSLVRLVLRVLE